MLSLPFSNPQFICTPAICILLEIQVFILWFLKATMKVQETQWPWSSKWKLRGEDDEQVTGSISDGPRCCTADASLFKYISKDSTTGTREGPASLEHHDPRSLHNGISVSGLYSSDTSPGPAIGTFWMQTETISWGVFGTVLSSWRKRLADNPRKYGIYFNSLYKSTFLTEYSEGDKTERSVFETAMSSSSGPFLDLSWLKRTSSPWQFSKHSSTCEADFFYISRLLVIKIPNVSKHLPWKRWGTPTKWIKNLTRTVINYLLSKSRI